MMTVALRRLAGCLLLGLGVMTAPATAEARTVLGVLARDSQQQVVSALQAEWSSALGDAAVVRAFAAEQNLLDWLLRYRELDAALLPQATFAAQPAGALTSVGTIALTSGPAPGAWFLAARGDLPAAQHQAIAQAFQSLLQQDSGLLLIERLVNPDAPAPVTPPVIPADSKPLSGEPVTPPGSAPEPAEQQPTALLVAPPVEDDVTAAEVTKPSPPEPRPRPIRTNAQQWCFPHVELQGKLGNERALADADLFLPILQDRISLLFLDLRFQLDDDEAKEGNFGLGFRRLFDEWIAGGYAFFDVRESQYDNTFRQVTLGAEALTANYDARFNLYLADEDKEEVADIPAASLLAYEGNYLLYSRSAGLLAYEKSMSGADFELGGRLPGPAYPEIRGYLGGYYFDAAEVEAIAGPRARVAVRFPDLFGVTGSYFELGGELTHDSERDTDYYLTAGLRIPLGGLFSTTPTSLTPLEKRMTERVQRDPDIVIGERRQATPATAPHPLTAAGVPITIAHVDSSGTVGSGTVEAPYGALPAAATTDIVLLHAGSTFPGGLTLADNQRLLGEYAGMNHIVATDQLGNIPLPSVTGGTAKPLIGDTVVAGSNTAIGGVVINSAAGPGISGTVNTGAISIHDVEITGAGADGITLASSGTLSAAISNATLSNVAGTGIRLDGTGGTLTVTDLSNLTITDAGDGGILADSVTFDAGGGAPVAGGTTTIGSAVSRIVGDGLALKNVRGSLGYDYLAVHNHIVAPLSQTAGVVIDQTGAVPGTTFGFATSGGAIDTANGAAVTLRANDPAELGLAVTLNSVASTSSPDYGVWLDNVGGTFRVSGATTVTDSTDDGVFVSNSSVAVTLNGLDITGAGLTGVTLADNSGPVTIRGGTINATGDAGILVQGASAEVSIKDVDVVGSGAEGMALVDNSSPVAISGGSIDDTVAEGIYALNSSLSIAGLKLGTLVGTGGDGIGFYADNGLSTSFSLVGSTIENTAGNGLTLEAVNGSTITLSIITGSLFDNIDGDGINIWAHDDALIEDLQIGEENVTARPAGIGAGDVSISNTGGVGIVLLAGDKAMSPGDNGTLNARINGVDISGTGGDNNIDLLVYGNGTGAYTVSNSYLDAASAGFSSIEIINSGSLPTDTPTATILIENNALLNSPQEGLYTENFGNAGVLNLRVIANESVPAGPGDVDGMSFKNINADTFSLYLNGNTSTPVGLIFDGYYLYNSGTTFNLGASGGNSSIGNPYPDDNGVIAAEGNAGSVYVEQPGGLLTIVDEKTIPSP